MSKKACLYTSTGRYGEIVDTLRLFISAFEIEQDVEPWMLPYREYALYVLEIDRRSFRNSPGSTATVLKNLSNVMRLHSTRVFSVWTQETWDVLKELHPEVLDYTNVVHCDKPNWVSALVTALKASERKIKNGSEDKRKE